MNKIVYKRQFSDKVFQLKVEAPLIAKARKAGHFIIVRVDEKGERIPLTIVDSDPLRGTITLIVQTVGKGTTKLCNLNVDDEISDVVGPLGRKTHIENFGTVLCAGGGVGTAPMLPIIKALKAAGNRVISVIAGRTKNMIILESEIRAASDKVIIMTDDGSYGQQGIVTVGMEQVIQSEKINKCFAIGPAIMMKHCCLLTKKYDIPTDVSLNTIMVDGTGMCGACRITVDGKKRFVCVDGPEFDGHKVDFDEMLQRSVAFRTEETSDDKYKTTQTDHKIYCDQRNNHSDTIKCAEKMDISTPISELLDRAAPYREELRRSIKAKERIQIPRNQMSELDASYRATKRTEEVNRGFTPQQAILEAKRCLDCPKPTCMQGCPVNVDIPSFIKNIERGEFLNAARILKNTSALPAVCGRVCPQEKQCESQCIHLRMNSSAVAIGYLERFAADFEIDCGKITRPKIAKSNGKKIAVVGSGPSGLSFAGDMAKLGYDVTVFEALHEIGGVLKYGIPEFRLPNRIVDVEIRNLELMGVHFIKDCIIGKTLSVDQLKAKDYVGIYIGSGAGLPNFMNIPGENSNGVMSSNEYLTRVNLMEAANPEYDTPINKAKSVMVVGGGNTAMDSCRTAKRLGAERVFIAYRRSEAEMPARLEEIKHAKEEGIEFLLLHSPIEYHSDENGNLTEVVLQEMELGEPDASGRNSPQPIPGATKTITIDQAIIAVGVSPNPIVPTSIKGLAIGNRNTILVNENMQTNIPFIYAGGDIVRGGATVILAMGDGRKAAASMHKYLNQQ